MGIVGDNNQGRSRSNVSLSRENSRDLSDAIVQEPRWVPNNPTTSSTRAFTNDSAAATAAPPGTASFVPASREARKVRMANSTRNVASTNNSGVSSRSFDSTRSASSATFVPGNQGRRKGRKPSPTNPQSATPAAPMEYSPNRRTHQTTTTTNAKRTRPSAQHVPAGRQSCLGQKGARGLSKKGVGGGTNTSSSNTSTTIASTATSRTSDVVEGHSQELFQDEEWKDGDEVKDDSPRNSNFTNASTEDRFMRKVNASRVDGWVSPDESEMLKEEEVDEVDLESPPTPPASSIVMDASPDYEKDVAESLRDRPETLLEAELVTESPLVLAEPLVATVDRAPSFVDGPQHDANRRKDDDPVGNHGRVKQRNKWLWIAGGALIFALILIGGLVGALVGGRSSSPSTAIVNGGDTGSSAEPTDNTDAEPTVLVEGNTEPSPEPTGNSNATPTEAPSAEASEALSPNNTSGTIPDLAEAAFLPAFSSQAIISNSSSSQAQALAWLQQHPQYNDETLMPDWRKLQLMALATLFYEAGGDASFLPQSESDRDIDSKSTNGQKTRNLAASWLDMDSNECQWESGDGASQTDTCTPEGQYQKLSLQSRSLRGILPPEISFMTSLVAIYLSRNQMVGSLPTEFGILTFLTEMDLNGNKMTGPIPSEIGKLTALTKLALNENLMTGTLPTEIGQMSAMFELWLSSSFAGTIPSEIGLLTSLTTLDLSFNELLSGTLPVEVASIKTLEDVWLNDNTLSGTIPTAFGSLPVLTNLILYGNNFTGNVTDDMCRRNSLRELKVDCAAVSCNCDLCGCIGDPLPTEAPTEADGSPNATLATAMPTSAPTSGPLADTGAPTSGPLSDTGAPTSDTGDADQIDFLPAYTLQTIADDSESPQAKARAWVEEHPEFKDMAEWRKLQLMGMATFYHSTSGEFWTDESAPWLSVDSNECDWEWAECHEDEKKVKSLKFPDRILRGTLPPELSFLSALGSIEAFDNGDKLTGSLPTELGLLTDLDTLKLKWNGLTGTLPTEFGMMTGMGWLELVSIGLVGSIPSELGLWTSCSVAFDLRDNSLSGTLPTELGTMSDLATLVVNNNKNLVGTTPSEFGMMKGMIFLWLAGNKLTGSVPSELGTLTNCKELVAAENQLTGSLPSEIGGMRFMTTLNLATNLLTGALPSEIGRNIDLTKLELLGNALTGIIPEPVCSLPDLDVIEVNCESMDSCECS